MNIEIPNIVETHAHRIRGEHNPHHDMDGIIAMVLVGGVKVLEQWYCDDYDLAYARRLPHAYDCAEAEQDIAEQFGRRLKELLNG